MILLKVRGSQLSVDRTSVRKNFTGFGLLSSSRIFINLTSCAWPLMSSEEIEIHFQGRIPNEVNRVGVTLQSCLFEISILHSTVDNQIKGPAFLSSENMLETVVSTGNYGCLLYLSIYSSKSQCLMNDNCVLDDCAGVMERNLNNIGKKVI